MRLKYLFEELGVKIRSQTDFVVPLLKNTDQSKPNLVEKTILTLFGRF